MRQAGSRRAQPPARGLLHVAHRSDDGAQALLLLGHHLDLLQQHVRVLAAAALHALGRLPADLVERAVPRLVVERARACVDLAVQQRKQQRERRRRRLVAQSERVEQLARAPAVLAVALWLAAAGAYCRVGRICDQRLAEVCERRNTLRELLGGGGE